MTRNLDIAEDAGDFFENHYSSGTFSGTHSGTFTGPISTSATFPAGMVLNVVSSSKTDIQTFTSTNTFETITGLSCAITPKSTSSKILIMGHLSVGNNTNTARNICQLFRDSTQVGLGDAGGSGQARAMSATDTRTYEQRSIPINFLDSPSTTSQITYTVKLASGSQPYHVNRDGEDGSNNTRCICTLTVMEIAG
tara:strand:+ start:109 stop:693 length:585 start_codon:yes stop_codon:yes gene_type:complete